MKSNVIPLGYLKLGRKFERAVLFKVLSDQLDLYSSLVRGQHGIAWIEVFIPKMSEEFSKITHLPKRKFKPNYIVDLMDNPGELIDIGSYEAQVYCGQPSLTVGQLRTKIVEGKNDNHSTSP